MISPRVFLFDTETAGLPKNYRVPPSAGDNWPRLVQIAWEVHDEGGSILSKADHIIKPEGFSIPLTASEIHGITTERAIDEGKPLAEILDAFLGAIDPCRIVSGHNVIGFDKPVVASEMLRVGKTGAPPTTREWIDTMTIGTSVCRIPGQYGFKWPKLEELHRHLFGEGFKGAHNAAGDVSATGRCFWELVKLGHIKIKKEEAV